LIDAKSNSALAVLEHQLRTQRSLGALSQSHVHRAVREDSLGLLIGREAILADWVGEDHADVMITADFGDMIAFEVGTSAGAWRGHRWIVREGDKIIRETLIEDRGLAKTAPPVHAPLGELRAGRGQYDAGTQAILPIDFPDAAVPLANLLHQAWNGRAFDLYQAEWLVRLVRTLPDATFYFERALVEGSTFAILWRVHGHHSGGQRVRLIGSSVITFQDGAITSDLTVVDFAALDAQLDRVMIDYA
jgi:predicted ester cyclase